MIRERIAAYAAAVGPTASGDLRYPLNDSDGVALAAEVGASNCRHAEQIARSAPALEAALKAAAEAKDKDLDALIAVAGKVKAASDAFWDAFEGEQVEGVTVIRRRA
ncbi:MAG: hypothetical protein AB7O95_20895 [Geminicoccaceae bacterium]